MDRDSRNTDEGLQGNEKIEQAVYALQQEPSEEGLAHALTVVRRRMREGGQFILAVEPPKGDGKIEIQAVQTADGQQWWAAFTSFEEELKGRNWTRIPRLRFWIKTERSSQRKKKSRSPCFARSRSLM